jgi:hypothetical protein
MVARAEQHIHNVGGEHSPRRSGATAIPLRQVHGFSFGVDDNFYRADGIGIHPAGPKTTEILPGRAVRADA